ncbi:MAG TPA: type I methionyl aminopeptidase [Halanaerobiales bacterium]|nr:type I methionyl aminopeptidase [Halanaerobiales bacterium]
MIILKSTREIDIMRRANQIVAETHLYLEEQISPGITTLEIDKLGEEFIKKREGLPSFKGYRGYPASICISLNDEVVHGIPSANRVVEEGDLLSLDIGVFFEGFHGDAARSFGVGNVNPEVKRLIDTTEATFFKGFEKALVNNRLSDISNQIQVYAENKGYSVVRDYVGHGIGREMHEDPQIPNFGPPGRGPVLKKGMTLAIEPMVNIGGYQVKTLSDEWTVVTRDGSLSAHYENTIVILDEGPVILSKV